MNQAAAAKPTPIIKLIGDACQEVLADRDRLPSMPDVTFRIRDAMQSPDWSIGTVATIIKSDPGTTTYLLKIANSVLFGGVSRVTEVEIAVARIGMESTRNLVTAHALRSMFVTSSPVLGAVMKQTWQNSSRLAAVSAVLAGYCPHVAPERALLAGLLQDIGVLPILNVLKRFEQQITDDAQIRGAIERYAAQVGMVLLMQWGFEKDMIEVARSRCSWFRDHERSGDLADAVLIARLHANTLWNRNEELPRIDEVPAFARLPLGDLSPEGSLECLLENEDSIDEVMSTLGAS